MKGNKITVTLFFVLLTLAVGLLSSQAVSGGLPAYAQVNKGPLTPPAVVFSIVWTVLYVLMGVGAARVWLTGQPQRRGALTVYGVQLAFNALWSVWFFANQAYLFSFFWLLALIGLILVMIRLFYRLDPPAGLLQLPYLFWCLFAAYLNLSIWFLNRPPNL